MEETATLGFLTTWGLVSLGVVISVILPILVAAVKKALPNNNGFSLSSSLSIWLVAKPYLLLGALSLVVGLLIALVMPQTSVQLAVLAGFAWDKTLQTIRDAGTNPASG